MALSLFLAVAALIIGVAARITHDVVARESGNGRADPMFLVVLAGVDIVALGIVGLIAVVSAHWPFVLALAVLAGFNAAGVCWRESLRALSHPRVLRPLAIGLVVILAIWLFGASLPFRAMVLQLAFLAFVVWLLLNLVRPFVRPVKKKD